MQLIHTETVENQYPVALYQRSNGNYRVTYGAEVNDNLDYIKAAEHYGYCLFHALACAGKLEQGE